MYDFLPVAHSVIKLASYYIKMRGNSQLALHGCRSFSKFDVVSIKSCSKEDTYWGKHTPCESISFPFEQFTLSLALDLASRAGASRSSTGSATGKAITIAARAKRSGAVNFILRWEG